MYYKYGNIYMGDFKNDKFDGKGIFYYINGNKEVGDYSQGKKIGKHITIDNSGNVVSSNNY